MRDGRRVDPHGRQAPDSGEGRTSTALTVGAIYAGGIEPFMPRLVSVRLPDGPVNAVSELREGRVRGFGGWLAQRSGMDLHVRRLVEREDEL